MNQIKTKQWYQIVENNCKKEEVIKFVAVIGLIYGSLSAQCFQIFSICMIQQWYYWNDMVLGMRSFGHQTFVFIVESWSSLISVELLIC